MSWATIFNRRLKSSPNNPPRAPAKMTPKGQPEPIDANFLLMGSHIERVTSGIPDSQKNRKSGEHVAIKQAAKHVEIDNEVKVRPHTAHVDKHVLESLKRSPSVDSSFYDKFERLDRDSVIGDMAYKEKHGRIKSAKQRPTSGRARSKSRSTKDRKRSNSVTSGSGFSRKPVLHTNTGSFFETAMSFDDETKQNTMSNAVRKISPRTVLGLNRKAQNAQNAKVESRRRPRSGRKGRERSPSCKRSERSNSVSNRSVGSGSACSSRVSRNDMKQTRRQRPRKSRSRTRRITPRPRQTAKENNSKVSSPERNASPVRSVSRASTKPGHISDEVRQRLVINTINKLPPNEHLSVPLKVSHDVETGSFAYSYCHPALRMDRKTSAPVRRHVAKQIHVPGANPSGLAAIDAVRVANETGAAKAENIRQMHEIDRMMYPENRKQPPSSIPRLRMMVAPTATPLASMVRASSAKMLMRHQYHTTV